MQCVTSTLLDHSHKLQGLISAYLDVVRRRKKYLLLVRRVVSNDEKQGQMYVGLVVMTTLPVKDSGPPFFTCAERVNECID